MVHFNFHLDIRSWQDVNDAGVTLPMLRENFIAQLAIFGPVQKCAIEITRNHVNSDVLGGIVEITPVRDMVFGTFDPGSVDFVLLIAGNMVLSAHGVTLGGVFNAGFTGHIAGPTSQLESTTDIGYGPLPAGAQPTASASQTAAALSPLSTVVSEDPTRNGQRVIQNEANSQLPTLTVPVWAKVAIVGVALGGGLLLTIGVLGYSAGKVAELKKEF